MKTHNPEYILKQDVAKRLNKTLRTVDNWMERGILPYYKMGRSVLFKWDDVEKHLAKKYSRINEPKIKQVLCRLCGGTGEWAKPNRQCKLPPCPDCGAVYVPTDLAAENRRLKDSVAELEYLDSESKHGDTEIMRQLAEWKARAQEAEAMLNEKCGGVADASNSRTERRGL